MKCEGEREGKKSSQDGMWRHYSIILFQLWKKEKEMNEKESGIVANGAEEVLKNNVEGEDREVSNKQV